MMNKIVYLRNEKEKERKSRIDRDRMAKRYQEKSAYFFCDEGIALVLSSEEFGDLWNEYQQAFEQVCEAGEKDDELLADLALDIWALNEGVVSLGEISLLRSRPESTKTFHMDAYLWKDTEKADFQPWKRDDSGKRRHFDYSGRECYVIYAENGLRNTLHSDVKPYSSYEEVREEFWKCIGSYLPDDFDWGSHIGLFKCRYLL